MTGPVFRLVGWFLGALPVDAAGRRCFDETLADWRSEAGNVAGVLPTIVIGARALWSVLRCVAMVLTREVRSREGAALLMRLAAWSIFCMLVIIGVRWNDSLQLQDSRVQLGPIPGALLSVGMVLGGMPILAFLSGAIGRRRPAPAPRLGPALVAGVLMFFALGWVLPVTNQAYREAVLAVQSNWVPTRGINELSILELVDMLFTDRARQAVFGLNVRLVFTVAVPAMLVMGVTARQLGGWRRVTVGLLSLLVFGAPLLSNLHSFEALLLMWPALMAAGLTTYFLARSSASPETTS